MSFWNNYLCKVEINRKNDEDESSPLMNAKTPEQAKLLLQYGADVDDILYFHGDLDRAKKDGFNSVAEIIEEYSTLEAKSRAKIQRAKNRIKSRQGELKGKVFASPELKDIDSQRIFRVNTGPNKGKKVEKKTDDKGMLLYQKYIDNSIV